MRHRHDSPALSSQLLVPFFCAAVAACGGETVQVSRGGGGGADASAAPDLGGITFLDEGGTFEPPDFGTSDDDGAAGPRPALPTPSTDDGAAGDTSGGDAPKSGDGCDAAERTAGCECDAGEDCASGFCEVTDVGRVCLDTCFNGCAAGFSCLPKAGAVDVIHLCFPRWTLLGQPCNRHQECGSLGDEGLALCIDYGARGSFCGVKCEGDDGCPDDYRCEERATADGSLTKQCIRTVGEFTCTQRSIDEGRVTMCRGENEHGQCAGERRCEAAGLTACDAATPAAETCNDLDDDCDGFIDNLSETVPCFVESAFGACQGRPVCRDGARACDGPAATPEICDGVDNDCDGDIDEGVALAGGPCDDGVACTADACDGAAGACLHQPRDESCDDGDACTTDRCDRQAGCGSVPATGAACEDGSACTVADRCDDGTCAGTPVAGCCSTSADCDDGNPCTADRCDLVTGACVFDPGPLHGTTCDADGDGCTVGDACDAGACRPGPAAACPASELQCMVAACLSTGPDSHGCTLTPSPAGSACSDGAACTSGEACDGEGQCAGGEAVPGCCQAAADCDDGNPCTVDSCDLASGLCRSVEAADGASCDADGDGCTEPDRCVAGVCVAGPAVTCADESTCNLGVCRSTGAASHACDLTPAAAGTECEDGVRCTLGDACDGAGACAPGEMVDGCCLADEDCDDGNPCTVDACDAETATCTARPASDGTACDADGDGCTDPDRCIEGACVAGAPIACADPNACTAGVCRSTGAASHVCESSPRAAGHPCDDGDVCTVGDACDGAGACAAGGGSDGCCREQADCDDGNPCTADACDVASGACEYVDLDDGVRCDADGDGCTVADACRTGVCVPGARATCADTADPCTVGTCTSDGPDAFSCTTAQAAVGAACDDGRACTADSTCDADGACTGGGPRDCAAELENDCLVAFCDELDGGCVSFPADDGEPCDDGSECTLDDRCVAGACLGSEDICVEERLSTGGSSGHAPDVAALGFGRYATLWVPEESGTLGRLRRTADDGSREDEEIALRGQSVAKTLWPSRMAVDAAGRHLVAVRDVTDIEVTLYDRVGRTLATQRVRSPSYGSSGPNHGDDGAIRALSFADGRWGLIVTWGTYVTTEITLLLLDQDLETATPIGLGDSWTRGRSDLTDAAVGADGSSFWVMWVSSGSDNGQRVMARRYAQNGTPLTDPIHFGDFIVPQGVSIASRPAGGAIATWAGCAVGGADCPHTVAASLLTDGGERLVDIERVPATGGNQGWPRVASFDDDGFIIVYQDDSRDHDRWGVTVSRFNAQGEPAGTHEVNDDWTGAQQRPTVAVLDDEDYVVAYNDQDDYVWTRRFTRDGSPSSGRVERVANTTTTGDRSAPSAGVAANGNVLVAWEGPAFAGGSRDIFVRLFNADGLPIDGERAIAVDGSADERYVSVSGHDNGFIVAYDRIVGSTSRGSHFVRLDANGAIVSGPSTANTGSFSVRRGTNVSARPDGSFVLGWVFYSSGNPSGQARAYHADGSAAGDTGFIMNAHTAGYQGAVRVAAHPTRDDFAVAYDWDYGGRTTLKLAVFSNITRLLTGPVDVANTSDGALVVDVSEDNRLVTCWKDDDGNAHGVSCRLYSYPDLTALGNSFRPHVNTFAHQVLPQVSWVRDGTLLVAWASQVLDADGYAGMVRSFTSSGEPRDPRRQMNRSFVGDQFPGFVLPVSTNRVWVGWTDSPAAGFDNIRFRVLQRF